MYLERHQLLLPTKLNAFCAQLAAVTGCVSACNCTRWPQEEGGCFTPRFHVEPVRRHLQHNYSSSRTDDTAPRLLKQTGRPTGSSQFRGLKRFLKVVRAAGLDFECKCRFWDQRVFGTKKGGEARFQTKRNDTPRFARQIETPARRPAAAEDTFPQKTPLSVLARKNCGRPLLLWGETAASSF